MVSINLRMHPKHWSLNVKVFPAPSQHATAVMFPNEFPEHTLVPLVTKSVKHGTTSSDGTATPQEA